MLEHSHWIAASVPMGDVCPVFRRQFRPAGEVKRATLSLSARGVYEAVLNGQRVGDYVLAPGWTAYEKRLQVQEYDVTGLLGSDNELLVTLGPGWFASPMPGFTNTEDKKRRAGRPWGLIGELRLDYADGSRETIVTDSAWQVGESPVRFSQIYDGEIYDAGFETRNWTAASQMDWPREILIAQEGEEIRETGRVQVRRILTTPAGETLVDFGQELTGYVELSVSARAGDLIRFTHGEVLDRDGNFYNENYRTARALVEYHCREGEQIWHPRLTFFGFRYLKLLDWPGQPRPEDFTAIVVHSQMERTGWLESGDPLLNRLFENIVWGQRSNFLDVPTDCPQRDERLGWTGDAQVFVKTASYFYDVERFFRKWLRDLAAEQRESGEVGQVIPDFLPENPASAAWGDAAVICPWQIYQTYGDPAVLAEQFESMRKWVDFIGSVTTTPDLWTGHFHFGDWLGLDAPSGSYKGSTRDDLIASAFYAWSTGLVVKAGELLGRDVSEYQALYERIVAAFRRTYPDYRTQTEHVLALQFELAEDPEKTARDLAQMVRQAGTQLRTGFVGTPYLLHVLTDGGFADLAWDLLLRREYPGWLYPVTKGATTMWEHWDGIRQDGGFWSADMNSFNHYAYGAVADWVFEQAAGLSHPEEAPGFAQLLYRPHPDPRVGWLRAELQTRHGRIRASWRYEGEQIRYELDTPVPTLVELGEEERYLEPGSYCFWQEV